MRDLCRMIPIILVLLAFLIAGPDLIRCQTISFDKIVVPNIMHQTYDYQSPNFFMYLSITCVQRYVRPDRHILWVNDEGKYRKAQWESWQHNALKAANPSWEADFAKLIRSGVIEAKMITFPYYPPGNESIYVSNKAHRSDFVRMEALMKMGGMYLDTDAFAVQPLNEMRKHNFTLSFDNIVNPDENAPKR